jgi:hypothetical protein
LNFNLTRNQGIFIGQEKSFCLPADIFVLDRKGEKVRKRGCGLAGSSGKATAKEKRGWVRTGLSCF